jgi:alpha-L-fucosidase
MGVGAYYCKADFHRKDYWNPLVFAESVHANYDSMKNTTLWNSYSQFVRGQLQEITDLYNPDILWLDGGWTNAPREDLRLDITAKYARGKNRDILIVNRGNGYFEDYLTPVCLAIELTI